ncbi:hypothetical protein SAMN05421770_1149 [Granulicella rosea]|uniref:Outer membrane protein, YaiO family n=1 Tax=Granulicella rosea TaxID=474952 RepID=A0A239MIZ5_9BACT|nr:hypothetical protein [Granulicella rosea]SNT42631.1 hypothetical protein SAMN05421770_1149 [Granulicella rosea]
MTFRLRGIFGAVCFAALAFTVGGHAQQSKLPVANDASDACPAAAETGDTTYPIRKLAFEALSAGRQAEARHLMRCALHVNPSDLVALRQIVYMDLNAGDESGAVEDIDALRGMNASTPTFEAQEGYILFHQKKNEQARAAFVRAMAGDDALIREHARQAIAVIDAQFPNHTLEIAVDGQYLNRFDDGVVDAYARYFERVGGKDSPIRAYVGARLLRDTASQNGPLPQIFSDNAFLSGVGLAYQPQGAHYFVSTEANAAYALYAGRNHTAAVIPDFRMVAGYYNLFRPGAGSPLHRLSVQANGSVGFYSRYQDNIIAYLQPQETYDLTTGALRISPFFQQSFAFDVNQQFYNNIAEMIPGVQFSLARFPGAALRAEYVRGYYLPFHTNSVNPYGSEYNDIRVRLTFDKLFFLKHSDRGESAVEPPAGGPH